MQRAPLSTVTYTEMPSSSKTAPPPSLSRLPSGRHKLSRESVEQSQRHRILVAMLHTVAERGYAATTVADIVAFASVSRSSFYANFTDKEACFVATYGFAMDYVLGRVRAATESLKDESWRSHAQTGLRAHMEVLASEPAFAITLHVEVLAAGPVAFDHRAQMLGSVATQFAELHELARAQQPELPEVPPAAFALYTGGLDELIRDRLRVGSPE